MSRPIVTASVATVLALLATTIWVPMRVGVRVAKATPQELADAEVGWERSMNGIDFSPLSNEDRRTAEMARDTDLLMLRGGIAYVEPAWPVRYGWVWDLRRQRTTAYPAPPEGGVAGDWIQWPVVLIQQLVVLLLGGGWLGLAVRRGRRRRAAELQPQFQQSPREKPA